MSENQFENNPTRRDLLRLFGGVAAANGLGALAWGALEIASPAGNADTLHKSVCRFCGTGCGVMVGMSDSKVTEIRGDELAHNKGVICIKGALLSKLPYINGRLTTPKIRTNGKFLDATWDEAMSLIASKFKDSITQFGPDSVAFYGSGQLFTEESYTANKLFKAGIRTNNVDGNPRLCMASAAVGYTQVYGKDEPPGSYVDIDHADCMFIIGANMVECHPALFERVLQRKRSGNDVKIIVIDPRKTLTAEKADIHLAPVPGTDMLLLNAMANVMFAESLLDLAFISKHVTFIADDKTIDIQTFKSLISKYTPEKVSEELGISANQIREVAFIFAKSKATTSLWTMGINQRTQGVFLNNMLNALHLLTGQFGRPGATPFSLTGQPNACGGVRDTGALAHALPAGRVVANPEHRREIEDLWGVAPGTISDKPGFDAISLFRAMEEGKVKAALIMGTNPAQSLPDSDRYISAMEKCFIVTSEIVPDSQIAQYTNVLLPAALWIEKEGVLGQGERRYQLVEKLIPPPEEAKSDLQILVEFADKLGYSELIKSRTPKDVWDEWRELAASSKYNFKGITYERLKKERGLQWPCPDENHPGTVRRYVEGDDPFVTPGAGIEFYGRPDKRAVVYFCPYIPSPAKTSPEFPYYLTTGRILEQWHTGTMTEKIDELARAAGAAPIDINVQDANKLNINKGDKIEIKSRYGSIQGIARTTSSVPQGVLFASFYDIRLLINKVVADNVDPMSKEPEYKITAISVRKLGA